MRTTCVDCGQDNSHDFDFARTRQFTDCVITVWAKGQKCPCGAGWIEAKEWERVEIAEADCLLALDTRDFEAFKLMRKMLGIGNHNMCFFFGITEEELNEHRFNGLIKPEWWDTLAKFIEEEKSKLAAPLPPCRGYTLG